MLAFWAGGLVTARLDGMALMDLPYGRMLADGVPVPSDAIAPNSVVPAGADPAQVLRFATEGEFPPFNFVDATGALRGIEIDIIYAVCADLLVTCEVTSRPWDDLLPGLADGSYEAVAASLRVPDAAAMPAGIRFSQAYLSTAAAFATQMDAADAPLAGPVGVEAGTRLAAYLEIHHPALGTRPYPDAIAVYQALADGEVPVILDDAVRLNRWLTDASAACCAMAGPPVFDDMLLGRGVGFAIRADNEALAEKLDQAIARLTATGRIDEITDRYLPFALHPRQDS